MQEPYLRRILAVVRALAVQQEPHQILSQLLDVVVDLSASDGAAVFEVTEAGLVPIRSRFAFIDEYQVIPRGSGLISLAVERREPVVTADYQREPHTLPSLVAAGVQAAFALPIQHEGRVLGVLGSWRLTSGAAYTEEQVELTELLTSVAAAILVGLDRTRMTTLHLTARTMEHEVNNRLTLTVGYAELLASDPRLPEALRPQAEEAMRGARDAAETVSRFLQIQQIVLRGWGSDVEPTIDLDRSTRTA